MNLNLDTNKESVTAHVKCGIIGDYTDMHLAGFYGYHMLVLPN